MHWKSDITSWKNPNTNEFITRKEYGKLGKRAAVNGLSIPKYLVSLGYYHDKYNYYILKDKMFLDREIRKDWKIWDIQFTK